jgi:hypothetical protein
MIWAALEREGYDKLPSRVKIQTAAQRKKQRG